MSSPIGDRIQQREPLFGWFLLATLLPILVMPFTNLEGNVIQRLLLPVSTLWLVLLSLRIMPRDLLRWRRWSFTALYRVLGLLCVAVMWLPFVLGHHAGHQ